MSLLRKRELFSAALLLFLLLFRLIFDLCLLESLLTTDPSLTDSSRSIEVNLLLFFYYIA